MVRAVSAAGLFQHIIATLKFVGLILTPSARKCCLCQRYQDDLDSSLSEKCFADSSATVRKHRQCASVFTAPD